VRRTSELVFFHSRPRRRRRGSVGGSFVVVRLALVLPRAPPSSTQSNERGLDSVTSYDGFQPKPKSSRPSDLPNMLLGSSPFVAPPLREPSPPRFRILGSVSHQTIEQSSLDLPSFPFSSPFLRYTTAHGICEITFKDVNYISQDLVSHM
jgi:hypothetical protein